MGLFDSLMGNASEADPKKVEEEMREWLTAGEQVESAFKLYRDLMVFTNKRLIMLDKQGVTGKKVEYHTVPYRSITHYSVETAGTFDLDSELKIWVSSTAEPVSKTFRNDDNIFDVQRALSKYVL
ncbi:PH domain-containing protein [Marinococcus halophilus]|uniref:Bacterial Pleckstrin homology domain-containing protein n=1 Tax=Marinococcus halophilus TaxID=1371 RepID=A0A510Y514_MARHA|nr:PH domain-containing protein [Marinococcus halophilus]OZT80389.1 PH domain-containing protein [Marinococcus halophilus]GEK58456.1 hypothetical protein MHA01_13610 [Marinococcus halophilus]